MEKKSGTRNTAKRLNASVLFVVLSLCGLAAAVCVSCASAQKRPPAVLVKCPEPMFWRLDGYDSAGKPATVYVQGTIGFYDGRLDAFPETVTQALSQARVVAAEVGSADWVKMDDAIAKKMLDGAPLDARVQDVRSHLSAEETAALNGTLGNNTVESLAMYEPWVLTALLLDAFYSRSPYKTVPSQDSVLMELAKKNQGFFSGLDTLQTQLDLLSCGSYAAQVVMLKDLIADTGQASKRLADMESLYAAYLSGHVSAFAAAVNAQRRAQDANPVYAAYNARLHEERNKRWALLFDGYLKAGGTTFVFADASHFAADNSVFEYMVKSGRLTDSQ